MLSRDETLAATLAILAALMMTILALLAGAGFFASPRATGETLPEPACAEWTDGCIVCARTPEGLACSTPGIACTRGRNRCLKP